MAIPVQLISSGGAAPTHYLYLAQLGTVTALVPTLLTFSNLFITRKSHDLPKMWPFSLVWLAASSSKTMVTIYRSVWCHIAGLNLVQ